MEVVEYLSVYRGYNLLRQRAIMADRKLTFPEFAILCHLEELGHPVRTSDIADYQDALRPTMTHRTKHLAELGFIRRSQGDVDRRNVICEITPEGRSFVSEACKLTCEAMRTGTHLTKTTTARVRRMVNMMGARSCSAGELVLLAVLSNTDERCTIGRIVDVLGLLQPTVSMSAAALEQEGLVERNRENPPSRSVIVSLTEEGMGIAKALEEEIAGLSGR